VTRIPGRVRSLAIGLAGLRRALRLVTVCLLALPVLVFIVGWLRTPIAVLLSVALGVAAAALVRDGGQGDAVATGSSRVSLVTMFAALIPITAAVLLSGVGGFGPRNWDWVKHDAVLRDLIVQPWPVRYLTEDGATGLTYYVAYYLPAAVVGKVAGWTAANLALAATSLLGAVLAVLWVVVLARGAPLLCGVVFALFSGMDVLGAALRAAGGLDLAAVFGNLHLEWWSGHWQYSSNVSLLYYAPHQALAAWLLTALTIDGIEGEGGRVSILAVAAVGLLWSPFVVLGLLPLLVAIAVRPGRIAASL
jgi:hypothetical protein